MTIILLIIILESKVCICGFQSYMMLNENHGSFKHERAFFKESESSMSPKLGSIKGLSKSEGRGEGKRDVLKTMRVPSREFKSRALSEIRTLAPLALGSKVTEWRMSVPRSPSSGVASFLHTGYTIHWLFENNIYCLCKY